MGVAASLPCVGAAQEAPATLHIVSACEGLGTAGDACPIVLPCKRARWLQGGCTVDPLEDFGYNPSAVPVPTDVREVARRAGIHGVAFLGSTRKWRWGPACVNRYTRLRDFGPGGTSGRAERSPVTATDVLMLDAQLRILARLPLVGGACVRHNHAAEDTRLLRVGERAVWATYVLFDHPDPNCTGGHWLARLKIDTARTGTPSTSGLVAVLEGTDSAPGAGLDLSVGKPLWSTRNAGLVAQDGRIAFELVSTTPITETRAAADGRRILHPAPPSLYGSADHPNKVLSAWHNSIHPLWVPELDGGSYLGVAHRHYRSRPTAEAVVREKENPAYRWVRGGAAARLAAAAFDHAPREDAADLVWQQARHWATANVYDANGTVRPPLRRPPFPFGSGYRSVLYSLTPTFRIRRHSKEFCLPSLSGATDAAGTPTACEAVQYVHAALRVSADAVALLYGINDCTSARATISLRQLDELLEYTYDPPGDARGPHQASSFDLKDTKKPM